MPFLVFQVGCIECGVSSYPIKVCADLKDAVEVAVNHPSTWDSEGGDGYVTIIDLEKCETVDEDAIATATGGTSTAPGE